MMFEMASASGKGGIPPQILHQLKAVGTCQMLGSYIERADLADHRLQVRWKCVTLQSGLNNPPNDDHHPIRSAPERLPSIDIAPKQEPTSFEILLVGCLILR